MEPLNWPSVRTKNEDNTLTRRGSLSLDASLKRSLGPKNDCGRLYGRKGRRTKGARNCSSLYWHSSIRFFYLCVCVPSAGNSRIALDALLVASDADQDVQDAPLRSILLCFTHLMRIYRKMQCNAAPSPPFIRQRIKRGQQRRRKWKGKLGESGKGIELFGGVAETILC